MEVGGFSLLGGNTEIGRERLRTGAPLIRVRAYNLLGGVTICRLPPQARGLGLEQARHLAEAVGRGELPSPG